MRSSAEFFPEQGNKLLVTGDLASHKLHKVPLQRGYAGAEFFKLVKGNFAYGRCFQRYRGVLVGVIGNTVPAKYLPGQIKTGHLLGTIITDTLGFN